MLDPHRLRVFRSVLASGSVGAAADNLKMSSSAVSQHLSALQRETGLTLFRREGRGLAPTPAALTLQAESDGLMGMLARLDSLVADLREGRSGRLTVGYFPSAGAEWMPQLAVRLTTEMPELTLDFVLNDSPSRTYAPDLDIVVEPPGTPPRDGYRRTDLVSDAYVAMLHRDHPLADAQSLHLADLQEDRWISNDPLRDIHTILVNEACAAAGFRPRYAVQAQDHHTAIAFVAAGVGVTVLPGLASHVHPRDAVVVPITAPTPIRHISVLSRERTASPAAVERAVELLTMLAAPGTR
ncbi:MAG TPA: LysR family transcriptional regulator [Intrasporangiaceae bacterium]|nr:LysR family transcriptional regulator [Intrasporangiaceae bacterium]